MTNGYPSFPQCYITISSWLILTKKVKYLTPFLPSNGSRTRTRGPYYIFHLKQKIVIFRARLYETRSEPKPV